MLGHATRLLARVGWGRETAGAADTLRETELNPAALAIDAAGMGTGLGVDRGPIADGLDAIQQGHDDGGACSAMSETCLRHEQDGGGWCGDTAMLALHARAVSRGIALPPYRTEAEFAAWVDTCAAALQPKAAPTVLHAELSPDDAAAQFLAWLRSSFGPETERTYDSDELSAAYAKCCTEHNQEPTPENHMRAALALQPGVGKRQRSSSVQGRRVRSFVWTVSVSGETETKTETKTRKAYRKTELQQPLQRVAA